MSALTYVKVSGGHFELEDTITTHIIKIISFVDSKLKILGVHRLVILEAYIMALMAEAECLQGWRKILVFTRKYWEIRLILNLQI
jgi:poly-beta-hydroxyalkanoate depolymerase